jgi:aminopeptidase
VLTERELEKYADTLLWGLKTARRGRFVRNDMVLLQYDPLAAGLAEIIYGRLLDLGLNPVQRSGLTIGMEEMFFRKAGKGQLTFVAPGEKEFYENLHGRIFLRAPASLTHLKDIDPVKIGRFLVSRKPLRGERRARLDALHAAHCGTGETGEMHHRRVYGPDRQGLLS